MTTQLEQCTSTILDSIAEGVFTVDKDWHITTFNRAAEEIIGISHNEAIGRICRDVFHSSICDAQCALRESIEHNKQITRSIYIINVDGERIPIKISATPLKDIKGNIIGGVETFINLSEIITLRKELYNKYSFSDIISKNKQMQNIFAILPDLAESDSTVLIEGDSGTGKELIALALHNLSRRKDKPCIIVNCAALPDTLLESELFGYKKGAFTDAYQDKLGRFALAEGGTIFLDEIGDVSPALQVHLLRVLQEKTYEPLGSTKSLKADVRIITATNKRLKDLMEQGKFREDLYYRLNVIRLYLPPLKERPEDIPLLIEHFVHKFRDLKGKNIIGISDEALIILMQYDFPGNIRELENIIEYSFILCKSDLIEPQHLPEKFRPYKENNLSISTIKTLAEIEKQAIYNALVRNNWKRMATAKELNIDKGTLRRKILKYNLSIE